MRDRNYWPLKYASVVGICVLASIVGTLLDAPSSCFMLVVMAVSLYGGRGLSIFAIVLSAGIFEYHFLPPQGHFFHSGKSLLRFAVFLGATVFAAAMIEGRRLADEARARINEEFRSLAETSPDCILFMNSDGCIDFANPVTETLFGFSAEELLGKAVSLLLPELKNNPSQKGEFTALRKNGQTFYVDSACGKFGEKTTVFLRDITDRKESMKKLEEAERSLRLTLETIPGLVFTRSAGGQIEYVNGSLSNFTGPAPKGVEADVWAEGLHPEERMDVLERSDKHLQFGQSFVMEYRRRRHDGVYRQFQTRVQPLRDSADQIIRWYGLATDIEERYQAEERLRQTQSKLAHAMQAATTSQLAASIVHEISQPLSAMVANGQACLRWLSAIPPNYNDGRMAVERIVRDGKDAASIIKGLRSLFRHAPVVKVPVNIYELLVEVISLTRAKAEREQVNIDIDVAKDSPNVMGDKIQLQQVILNLLNNGIESMQQIDKQDKTLKIRVSQKHSQLTVSVEDQGIGLENYDSIFEPFVTTKEDGMGMGLAICRSIVEIHEGKLWGRASGFGGSVFSFTLPFVGAIEQ